MGNRINMEKPLIIEPCLADAIMKLQDYILNTTGQEPTQKELSNALTKFFVLKEIREFIEMSRQQAKETDKPGK